MKLPLAALVAGFALSHTATAEPRTFDGTWSIQLVTHAGLCDANASTAVTVANGRVNGGAGVSVSGQIGSNGTVNLALQKGPASGAASGTLGSGSGSGTWTVSTLGCSGRWTAQRRSTQTAQASF